MGKKKFIAIAFNLKHETFIVFTIYFSFIMLNTVFYLFQRPQIVGLIVKKAFTKVFAKYADFTYIFS